MTQPGGPAERRSELSAAKQVLLEKRLRGLLTPPCRTRVIAPHPRQEAAPLSFSQERLWFLDRWQPGNIAYNRPLVLQLTGHLDVPALSQALTEVLRRHQVLRATVSTVDGHSYQKVKPLRPVHLVAQDLGHFPASEREHMAQRLAKVEIQKPFDLNHGPLWRANLMRLAAQEHLLVLVMHHIVFDAWSARLLAAELATLYDAYSAGMSSPLPELPLQYADYAHWQREWLQGEVLREQLDYWQERLAGAPPVLDLPTDRPRPAARSYRGSNESLTLSPSLLKALRELSLDENVTLFMTLLGALDTLLHRYTGEEDVLVGTPVAARSHVETESLIGFFANTLVLRVDLAGNPTFRELLQRVRDAALGAYEHQDMPFAKLVEWSNPERDPSRSPLFDVMFSLRNIPIQSAGMAESPGLDIRESEFDSGIARFDLTWELVERSGHLECSLNYNTDLFEATTIMRMLGHFRTLLGSIVRDPDQRIGSLPMLPEGERRLLLMGWNNTRAGYPDHLCVHQLFEAQTDRDPDRIAVSMGHERMTYRELDARANQLACHLQERGVSPGVPVGICVERTPTMIVGLLGILKAGGTYVPLEPAFPKERLAFILQDTQAPVLLAQEHLLPNLPENEAQAILLDGDRLEILNHSDSRPTSGVQPVDLAYIIYTSGSTGRPKGVQICHRSVVNLLHSMQRVPGFGREDTLLAVTTISFDIAALEVFLPLSVGGRVELASRQVASDGIALAARLVESGATVMQATPATWRMLLESGWHGDRRLKILCGGEALPRALADRLLPMGASLWNLYGPTETTIWSSVDQVRAQEATVPIGRPIANTQIYLLDSERQPVPVGIAGELHIGGEGLAQGYLGRPELDLAAFIPNPFCDEPGTRLYKTGDLARWGPDGRIEYLQRVDRQVKVRGYRIELGEIETVLSRHPGVSESVVQVREDVPGDQRLVAYVVPVPGTHTPAGDLREFSKEKLPRHMVPTAFVTLDSLPLTPNRKVDSHALPAPDYGGRNVEQAFIEPRGTLENQLAQIFGEVLGIEVVGATDNFFDLGGHSLLALRLLARINQAFECNMPLARLFHAPTVRRLAETLRTGERQGEARPSSVVAIQPHGSRKPLFIVPGNMANVHTHLGDMAGPLGLDQPLYGFQDGSQNPSRVIHLASHYVDEMRRVQPEGPYLLGGICSGAVVALEMAHQLLARGERVSFLAVIEPYGWRVPGLRTYAGFAALVLRRLFERGLRIARRASRYTAGEQGAYLRSTVKLLANSWALRRYQFRPYPDQFDLFLTRESSSPPDNPRLRWCTMAVHGATVHELSGTHASIAGVDETPAEPEQMRALAEQLGACIERNLQDG